MRVTSLIISALLTIASAHPLYTVVTGNAASIVAALQNAQTNIHTLNATVNTFNKGNLDGLIKVLKIQKVPDQIPYSADTRAKPELFSTANYCSRQFRQGCHSNCPSVPGSERGDTFKVAQGVLSLKADLDSFLPNISSKKPAFDGVLALVSVSKTVARSLQDQKAQSTALGSAIKAKLTGPLARFAPLINAQIADQFSKAIAVFQQPGGVVSLPPLPSFP